MPCTGGRGGDGGEETVVLCKGSANRCLTGQSVHPGTSAPLVVGGMDEGVIKNLKK